VAALSFLAARRATVKRRGNWPSGNFVGVAARCWALAAARCSVTLHLRYPEHWGTDSDSGRLDLVRERPIGVGARVAVKNDRDIWSQPDLVRGDVLSLIASNHRLRIGGRVVLNDPIQKLVWQSCVARR
jgi:hypothetical protein